MIGFLSAFVVAHASAHVRNESRPVADMLETMSQAPGPNPTEHNAVSSRRRAQTFEFTPRILRTPRGALVVTPVKSGPPESPGHSAGSCPFTERVVTYAGSESHCFAEESIRPLPI